MAWSESKIFPATLEDIFEQTTAMDADTHTHKAALYNNSITPDQTVAAANTAYNVGQWANTNEVSDGTNWDAGGEPLSVSSVGSGLTYYMFDSTDTSQGGASCTLANVYGCLVYNDTISTPVADQGLCYNYFGGVQSVTGGTFTIVWHPNGVWRLTL